jgi:hypothetical protein
MSEPRTFHEYLAEREIRKREGRSTPLPPAVEPLVTQFLVAALAARDPAALAAEIEVAAADVEKAARDAVRAGSAAAARPVRPAIATTPAAAYIAKGGSVWQQIETGAAALVGTTPARLTKTALAQAVSQYLDTPEGRTRYVEYCAEQAAVAAQEATARRDRDR